MRSQSPRTFSKFSRQIWKYNHDEITSFCASPPDTFFYDVDNDLIMVPSCFPGLEPSFDIYNAFWRKYAETLFMRNTPAHFCRWEQPVFSMIIDQPSKQKDKVTFINLTFNFGHKKLPFVLGKSDFL